VFRQPAFDWSARLFYYSKYVEFADTWFLVIQGKYVSWLQYFHHAGAAFDMWGLYRYENEGIWIFVQFNSLIHTIMYFYFGLSVLKITFPGKWIITVLQIAQLTIGNSLSVPYIMLACYRSDHFRMLSWSVNFMYINVLVVLFLHFSVVTYILPLFKKSSRSRSKPAAGDRGKGLAVNPTADPVHGNGDANGDGNDRVPVSPPGAGAAAGVFSS